MSPKFAMDLGDPTLLTELSDSHQLDASCPRTLRTTSSPARLPRRWTHKVGHVLKTYCKFVGPGFMISVAYIDPGNYATDVAAGASHRFKLLFMVLLSNIFAIFLQSLCIHLGTVTGMNLSQMTRLHCPRWLNYASYLFGESAIIATDMAEVIGTAIALNLLSNGKIPLVAGCAISIVDVLVILVFYSPTGATKTARRIFEAGVALLVVGVMICFCIQLSYIQGTTVGEVFKGYLPSSALVKGSGLYQACGILGATVMPHSLYLGSGLVQDRIREFDSDNNITSPSSDHLTSEESHDDLTEKIHIPSIQAIRACMGYSIAELTITLFTFALFVNSAILIVAGAALYGVNGAPNAGLETIYHLLSQSLAPAAGTIFAIALLLSGTSAGIICTIAGQMVSEGQLRWTVKPWIRRLITRSISITPSIIIAGSLGEVGLNKALVASQVALSVILPFVSAPLLWFTCVGKYMTVLDENSNNVNMRVHLLTAFFGILIWAVLVVMNVALLVFVGLGMS